MEYVVVSYSTARNVRLDGRLAGKTNDTLMVERGHHRFDLGDPQDYQPTSVEKDVQDTTTVTPLVIADFKPSRGVV
jgi:hypothetical protein